MARIRVLLVDLPGLLRDLVMDALAGRPDMNMVGEAGSADGMVKMARDTGADVVIVSLRDAENGWGSLDAVLYELPRLKVMGIARDGRTTSVREMRPHTVMLGNIGPDELADAIRKAVGGAPTDR